MAFLKCYRFIFDTGEGFRISLIQVSLNLIGSVKSYNMTKQSCECLPTEYRPHLPQDKNIISELTYLGY